MYIFRESYLSGKDFYNKDGYRTRYTGLRENGDVNIDFFYDYSEIDAFGNFTKEIVTNQEGEVDVINIFTIEYY